MRHRYILSVSLLGIIVMMSNCTSDSGSPGPQPETYTAPKNPPMDSGANGVNNNNNDRSVTGSLPYSLKSSMTSMMNEMKGIQLTGNFDLDFAKIMAVHHKGAIAMSQLELDAGKDSTMKNIAEEIRNRNQQEINDLNRFSSNTQVTGGQQGKAELQKSMNAMESNLDTIRVGNNMDTSFARMMKFHHEQGLGLAKKELSYGKSPDLKRLAQNIVSQSGKEIQQFNSWIKKREEQAKSRM
jgi:uncharacterized protein (DUF305 family)